MLADELTLMRPNIIVAPRAWLCWVVTVGVDPVALTFVAKMLRSAASMALFRVLAAEAMLVTSPEVVRPLAVLRAVERASVASEDMDWLAIVRAWDTKSERPLRR